MCLWCVLYTYSTYRELAKKCRDSYSTIHYLALHLHWDSNDNCERLFIHLTSFQKRLVYKWEKQWSFLCKLTFERPGLEWQDKSKDVKGTIAWAHGSKTSWQNTCCVSTSGHFFKGTMTRDFWLQVFLWISFLQTPEYTIRAVSNVFENSPRYSQLKVHHLCRWYRWQKSSTETF